MHMVLSDSVVDLSLPSRCGRIVRLARRNRRRGAGLLGTVAQSVMFFAVLWLLAAGPGFLSARDSLVPAGTGRLAPQASR